MPEMEVQKATFCKKSAKCSLDVYILFTADSVAVLSDHEGMQIRSRAWPKQRAHKTKSASCASSS